MGVSFLPRPVHPGGLLLGSSRARPVFRRGSPTQAKDQLNLSCITWAQSFMTTASPVCIYIDVDQTLVRTVAGRWVPNQDLRQKVREWKAAGAVLYCWSSQGADYARRAAQECRVADCFVAFLPKPHVLVDDQKIEASLLQLAPTTAARLSVAEIRTQLETPEPPAAP